MSALPLYAAAIERFDRCAKLLDRFPGRTAPVVVALAIFGMFAVLLTAAASLIAGLQPG